VPFSDPAKVHSPPRLSWPCQPCEAPGGPGVYKVKSGEHNSTFRSVKGTHALAYGSPRGDGIVAALMRIAVGKILALDKLSDYKIHFAVRNERKQEPLDVFHADPEQWKGWNSWRRGCDGVAATRSPDDFSRRFIFSLIRYYPEHETDMWLFGGIFEVLERKPYARYMIEEVELHREYVGRLIIQYRTPGHRGRAFNLENHFQGLQVAEILKKPYEGEAFHGHKNVELRFAQLETIIRQQRADWKAALDPKGVYLIVDRSNGKMYVGSAAGDAGGIWSRWTSYIMSGHGGNHELKRLIAAKGIEHARQNFYFSILEILVGEDDRTIINREQHWKRVLQTTAFGNYNKN
jgi:hypothetical protein